MSKPWLEPPYGLRDPGRMASRIASQPEQIEEALTRAAAAPWRLPARPPTLLAVGALGGSAIAADLTAALYHDRLEHPLIATRDYRWPAYVGHDALGLLCSYSGETEETLALYRDATARGIPRAAITSGGTLAEWCVRDKVPCALIPGGSPPRAALFSSWVALTALLETLGWIESPTADWIETAFELRERHREIGPDAPESVNPVKQLARHLSGRFVFIYSGTHPTGAAAVRLRQQLNENAKMPGHSAVVPELNHNEIVGWEHVGKLSKSVAVLLMRDAEDSTATHKRLTLTGEYATRQGAAVYEVESVGAGRLARLASLVQFGDYLSLYVALVDGVDPTPVESIDEFKRRLAESARRRE